MQDKKSNRGGKRRNSGRKKKFYGDTVRIEMPKEMADAVITVRDAFLSKAQEESDYPDSAVFPAIDPVSFTAPLYSSMIPAGFPSPADDHMEKRLDLNEHFISSPASTFFLRAVGDSMNRAGVFDHTILQVDRSLEVRHNDIVVAAIDGEFTVKRYIKRNDGVIMLSPDSDNPMHQPIICRKGSDIVIFGVVNGIHQKLR